MMSYLLCPTESCSSARMSRDAAQGGGHQDPCPGKALHPSKSPIPVQAVPSPEAELWGSKDTQEVQASK